MKILDIFKRKEATPIRSEDLEMLYRMLYRQVNRDIPIPVMADKSQYIRLGYAANPTVYSIINQRSAAAKGIPWLVYKVVDEKKLQAYRNLERKDFNLQAALTLKEQALEEVSAGPVHRLMSEPHPDMTWQDIMEATFIYRDVTGDSYLYMLFNGQKEIVQFHPLPADRVKIIGGTFLDPVKGYRFDDVWRDELPKGSVLHWKYFNPIWDNDGRQLYGLSPLQAAARIINSDNAGIDNEAASFANEGVKAILTGKENPDFNYTKEQMDLLLKRMRRATARAKAGEGNIMFNRLPLELIKLGETPVDLGVLESRKYAKEVLCNVYRIHPSLLSSDAATLDNMKEARKALITMSVLPDMDNLRAHLNKQITKSYGPGWFVDYDIMAISELQDDIEKLARTLGTMDWITINEKRAATQYDDYVPGADPASILYTDMSKIPLGYGVDSSTDDIDEELNKRR
jgi:HK97 family phage portal protein